VKTARQLVKSLAHRLSPVTRQQFDAERNRSRRRHRELSDRLQQLERALTDLPALTVPQTTLPEPASTAPADPSVLTRPSYVASVARTVRLRDLRRSHGIPGPDIWRYNSKAAGRALADELNIRTPRLHHSGPLHSVPEVVRALDAAVVKPLNGAGAKGVALLARQHDCIYEVLTDRQLAPLDVEAFVLGLHQTEDEPYLVEELIVRPGSSGRPSFDWKMLCMGGRCELVIQIDRNSVLDLRRNRFKYWTREWDVADVTLPQRQVAGPELPEPLHGPALVEMSEKVAAAIPGAFVRVDLFEDVDGPVFGEITPHPNGGRHRPNFYGSEWDERLGLRWEAAEIALLKPTERNGQRFGVTASTSSDRVP
jgi:hypothetical protein